MMKRHRAGVGFIFITLILDVTGLGVIIPVIPQLIEQLTHGSVSEASQYGGWLITAYACMQFIFAPILGNLSDRYGRRPIILGSLLGFSLNFFIQAWAPTIIWLFVGRILSGITGASITTAGAYIADVSDEENRAKNFGLISVAFGIGFIIGPVLGGLLGHYGARVPFIAAALLSLLNFVYGYFLLPESLPPAHRRSVQWRHANPIAALLRLKAYPQIFSLILVVFLVNVALHAVQSNWSFYGMYKFGWNERTIGISLGVVGCLIVIVQGFLLRIINPRIGNNGTVLLGLTCLIIAMILFAFATQSWMMYVFSAVYCLGNIGGPALQAMISLQVQPWEQGNLQGAMTSVISLTSMIGPTLMTHIFYDFTNVNAQIHFSGAPFMFAAALVVVALLVFRRAVSPAG